MKQTAAAFEELLGGVHLLLRGLHVGLRFDDGFGHGDAGGGAEVGLGLVELALVGGGGGAQVAVFQHGEELARP